MAATYRDTIPAYAQGRRANAEEWNTITRTNSGAAAIGFGVPVMPGSGEHTCVELSATTGQNVLGITEASVVLPATSTPADSYAQYDSVAICEVGVIGVLLGKAVAKGAQARWHTGNKTWTDAAQSATVVTIPGAQFDEAGANGAIGIVRYRRPVPSLSVSG